MSNTPFVYTYSDVIDHLVDLCQGHSVGVSQPILRRIVAQAYREILAAHAWSFAHTNTRIHLQAAESLTAVYDHADGANERQLTATTAFPDWIVDGSVRIGDIVCDVESSVSSTVVVLDATVNPGQDVASGTVVAYPRWYTLPNDFSSLGRPLEEAAWHGLQYVSMDQMLALDRYRSDTGDPVYYSVGPAEGLYGSMALFLHPPSNTTETLDFIYEKRFRELRYSGHAGPEFAGTIAVSAGSAAVVGTNTSFASGMIGSILRIGDTNSVPTGREGLNPFIEQRSIKAVANSTNLTLDAGVSALASGAKFRITDPIDIHEAAYNAFLAACEHGVARMRNFRNKRDFELAAEDALFKGKSADGRTTQRRVAGSPPVFRRRLKDRAIYSDIP